MKIIDKVALGQRVLAVAVERVDGWTAYIDAVPGIRHDDEAEQVAQNGSKLLEPVARAIFRGMDVYGEFCP